MIEQAKRENALETRSLPSIFISHKESWSFTRKVIYRTQNETAKKGKREREKLKDSNQENEMDEKWYVPIEDLSGRE